MRGSGGWAFSFLLWSCCAGDATSYPADSSWKQIAQSSPGHHQQTCQRSQTAQDCQEDCQGCNCSILLLNQQSLWTLTILGLFVACQTVIKLAASAVSALAWLVVILESALASDLIRLAVRRLPPLLPTPCSCVPQNLRFHRRSWTERYTIIEMISWLADLWESLDSEVPEPQSCSFRLSVGRKSTSNWDNVMIGSPVQKQRFWGFKPPVLQLEAFPGQLISNWDIMVGGRAAKLQTLRFQHPKPRPCSMSLFLDRKLTGNCDNMAGKRTGKLGVWGFRAPVLQLEGFPRQKV